ncbi:MAG: hypothetical protein MN733_23355 [Nitrososphaera sp.]|nr:hypothetical protein [Nitrososphaera sp.]
MVDEQQQDNPTKSIPTESELTTKISSLEEELKNLYAQRAGRMIDDAFGWCCVCGRNTVCATDGNDTCPECLHLL